MIKIIKNRLSLLYTRIISCENALALGIAVYLIFVFIGLVNLNFHFYPPVIDWEATYYGNVAVGMLDGITQQLSLNDLRVESREGSVFLLSPVVALFFSLFGENYYTLQKMGVFLSGFWALVWFLVACELFKKKRLLLAFIFIFATPLIHQQKSVLTGIFTHFGVSILFGLSLLFLLKSRNLDKNKKKLILFISGVLYSVSVFYGFISLLLLPMILILFLSSRLRLSSFIFWLSGFFVALVFYFQHHEWEFLYNTAQLRLISDQTIPSIFISLLVYFGGILKNDKLNITLIGDPDSSYSLLSVFYLVFLLILALYWLTRKETVFPKIKSVSIEFIAFFVGSVSFLAAVAYYRYPMLFDIEGLRYLRPLAPFYLLALCYFLVKHRSKLFIKISFFIYFTFTIFALYSFIHPLQGNNKEVYSQIGGFNAAYMFISPSEITAQINLENAADSRLGRYTFAMGRVYLQLPYDFPIKRKEIERQLYARPTDIKKHALDEFVRGYYFQKGLNLNSCRAVQRFFEENQYSLDPLIAQGLGMGIAKRSFDKEDVNITPGNKCLEEIYNLSNKDTLENLGWGYGRHFHHSEWRGFFISDKFPEYSLELRQKTVIDFYDLNTRQIELFVSDKFKENLALYEGILRGKNWTQKHYHIMDLFPYTRLAY